jgi:hypothetical protein
MITKQTYLAAVENPSLRVGTLPAEALIKQTLGSEMRMRGHINPAFGYASETIVDGNI